MTWYRRRTSRHCSDTEDGLWCILKVYAIFGGLDSRFEKGVIEIIRYIEGGINTLIGEPVGYPFRWILSIVSTGENRSKGERNL